MTKEDAEKQVHPSHTMTAWQADIRAPAGTPRFYSVRVCQACGEEQGLHVAGYYCSTLLTRPCYG